MSLFETDPITQNNSSVESQSRLRAVPLDEFSDGVIVGPLSAFRREGVENGGFRLFQIGQGEDAFRDFFFFRDFGIGDGILNRRFDRAGKVIIGRQVVQDSGVTVRRRYRKLDNVRRLCNALSRLVSMSGR